MKYNFSLIFFFNAETMISIFKKSVSRLVVGLILTGPLTFADEGQKPSKIVSDQLLKILNNKK